jgi:hypothetical protein
MAEKTIVVCDVCGKPATETVTIKVARGNYAKDLCATHVTELVAGARRPRPGRPRKLAGATAAQARRGRPRKTPASKTAAKRSGRATARRRRQPRRSSGSGAAA